MSSNHLQLVLHLKWGFKCARDAVNIHFFPVKLCISFATCSIKIRSAAEVAREVREKKCVDANSPFTMTTTTIQTTFLFLVFLFTTNGCVSDSGSQHQIQIQLSQILSARIIWVSCGFSSIFYEPLTANPDVFHTIFFTRISLHSPAIIHQQKALWNCNRTHQHNVNHINAVQVCSRTRKKEKKNIKIGCHQPEWPVYCFDKKNETKKKWTEKYLQYV